MNKRDVLNKMRDTGAVSVYTARTIAECGLKDSPVLRDLMRKKVVAEAGSNRYYIDESRLMEVRMTTVKTWIGLFFLGVVVILVYLIRK